MVRCLRLLVRQRPYPSAPTGGHCHPLLLRRYPNAEVVYFGGFIILVRRCLAHVYLTQLQLINRRGSCSSRSVIRFPPHAALDIDRAVLETQTQATQLATHLNVVPDLVVKNGDVVAHPLSPRDSVETSAGLVLPAINPEGTARRRVSRGRSAPHRATNREVRDLRLQTLKVKRALKQLGAEHMLEHFTALLNTTKPGSTTRSRHRTQVEFSAGPLVGTRARRREGSTAD